MRILVFGATGMLGHKLVQELSKTEEVFATVELTPAYCYQEELNMPFERKLVALKKNHSEWTT